MKKIIVINTSPRKKRNTAALVTAAAEGAREAGAEAEVIHIYDIKNYTGCISCFGCKLEKNLGRCICQDGLTEVLEKIREADGLVIGTLNYLAEASAGFRALYERLIFQYITYKKEIGSHNNRKIPVLFIMNGNAPESAFTPEGAYGPQLEVYRHNFEHFIGPTTVLTVANTKQVDNYSLYQWTAFDAEDKIRHHEETFSEYLEMAKRIGKDIARNM